MSIAFHFRHQAHHSLRQGARLGALALLWLAGPSPAAETALQPGEEFTYSVRWAVLPSAGRIKISAAQQVVDGSPKLSITTQTETRGLARGLIAFEAKSESIFDVPSGRLISLRESSVARAKRVDYLVEFDYDNGHALYTGQGAESARTLDLPEGDPADLITTLMKTRLWDLQVGEARDVLVSFRDDFYLLTIHALHHERVKTPLGEFDTIAIEPRMEKSPPKGMFKRGAHVKVWVSRDAARLPVRLQVAMKVGTGVATLVKYSPPDSSEGRAAADE